MPEFTALWEGGPVFAQAEHFKLGTDCVLLADFVNSSGRRRGIDLGCASGAIALLLLWRSPRLHMTGLELVEEAAELARENMEKNSLEDRSTIICGDIRRHRELFKSGSFDLVASNPPYFPPERGKLSPDEKRSGARGELSCTLEDICTAAAYLCCTGGSFSVVYKPERLSELFCAMTAHGLEPKRLRLERPQPGAGGGPPGRQARPGHPAAADTHRPRRERDGRSQEDIPPDVRASAGPEWRKTWLRKTDCQTLKSAS